MSIEATNAELTRRVGELESSSAKLSQQVADLIAAIKAAGVNIKI